MRTMVKHEKTPKNRKYLYILLILALLNLCIPLVLGATTIEYGLDNATWNAAPSIDEVNKVACVNNLDENTRYYFRGKNATTSFDYLFTKTTGANEMEIAIMIGLSLITLLAAAGAAYFENELRLFFFLGTAVSLVFDVNMLAQFATAAMADQKIIDLLWFSYRIMLYIFWFLVLYVIVKLFLSLRVKKDGQPQAGSNEMNKRFDD